MTYILKLFLKMLGDNGNLSIYWVFVRIKEFFFFLELRNFLRYDNSAYLKNLYYRYTYWNI